PGLGSAPKLTSEAPFISHTAGKPSAFCHSRSAVPSRSKSPVATMCQDEPGFTRVVMLATVTSMPFINQICGVPSVFWSTTSAAPSTLKSLRTPGRSEMVVVAGALRLLEALPSLTTQENVRLVLEPKLVGFAPALNVTEPNTFW